MHRELAHTDEVFEPPSQIALYLLTAVVGALLACDVWPALSSFFGLDWPLPVGRTLFGYRCALLAAVLGGARVLYGALDSLLAGRLGADLALVVACVAAILIGEPVVAAEVVFIGLIGECLEGLTFAYTQRAVGKLVEVFPLRCWLLRDGVEVRVFTKDVQPGDTVVVKPGAKVPVDGVVRAGTSAVDESALTGESLPVDKVTGNAVLAGSVNRFGALTIEATQVAGQTVAGRVIDLTAKALKDKSPQQRTADRLAQYFLPAVLLTALLTYLAYLGWHAGWFRAEKLPLSAAARAALYPALAVLVVACPCALILATPAAVIAALGRLAGTGVLVKSGAALERLASVTHFAFDKTGTLTEGKLTLGELHPVGISADELLQVAASAEQASEHPLARMLVTAARDRGLSLTPAENFQAHPGAGVTATVAGREMIVGTARLLGVPDADAALFVARDGVYLGSIGATDRLRHDAKPALAELRQLGLRLSLLTGDRASVAQAVADELEIPDVHAALLPHQKAEFIQPQRTAFVGDGINDAPALATAAVGLAVGSGTDIAAEAGDIVLLGDPLKSLPLLVGLSRETVRVIRQNIIVFAFGVNLVGVALTGWLWPLLAPAGWQESAPLAGVLYHQVGSFAVLLNSMRLLAFARGSGWRNAAKTADDWLARLGSVDDWLHELAHRWRQVLAWGGGAALLLWALSGLTQIGPDELGIARRFGRPLPDDLTPGLHWRFPWPVEAVAKVKPDYIRSVEVGFRKSDPAAGPDELAWNSPHAGSVRRLGDEGAVLTGDGGLVELLATVRYRVSDPRAYLFAVADVDALLRHAAESALREAAAGEPFLDVLTTRRDEFRQLALAALERRFAGLNVGVALDGLALHDLHPPLEVVPAFHEVARAMELRDKRIQDAEADALRRRKAATAEGQALTRRAEEEAFARVAQAKVVRDEYAAWHRARHRLDVLSTAKLLGEVLLQRIGGRDWTSAVTEYVRRRDEMVIARRQLIDARLAMEALTSVLAGRDKVLIDADQVPGRRQLLLFDPELLRPILPPPPPAKKDDGP